MSESRSVPLLPEAFRRYDEAPDEVFYQMPRFVTHIDNGAIAAVTQLYREFLPANSAILDLMSSWISHLPAEIPYREVVGLGMNREELAANSRLTEFVVQNLNTDPTLPFADNRFDGAAICVSVDYLTDPVAVLQETARVLQPGARIVITFSNRCFPTKAVAVWHPLDDHGRMKLVARYLEETGRWSEIQTFDRTPASRRGDPLLAVVARREI